MSARFTPRTAGFPAVENTTNASGSYSVSVPVTGYYDLALDGEFIGVGFVAGSTYRGELIGRGGVCVSRYGVVYDASRLRPIVGARVVVGGGIAMTGSDGWYRIDLGCESFPAGGTTFLTVIHPDYETAMLSEGRRVIRVLRNDVAMDRVRK